MNDQDLPPGAPDAGGGELSDADLEHVVGGLARAWLDLGPASAVAAVAPRRHSAWDDAPARSR